MDEAACFIIDKQTDKKNRDIDSIEDVVDLFIKKNTTGLSEEEYLTIDRESLWMDIIRFYKKTMSKPDILKRELSVYI